MAAVRPAAVDFEKSVMGGRSGQADRPRLGISGSCLRIWFQAADVEDGNRPGRMASESAELRDLRRRNRLLEQEVEVLRRVTAYLSQAHLPGR